MILFKNLILVFVISCLASSCTKNTIKYDVDELREHSTIQLKAWHILGPIKNTDIDVKSRFLNVDHLALAGISDSLFCINPFGVNVDIPNRLQIDNTFYDCNYISKYPIVDFNQLKRMNLSDPNVQGAGLYYYCSLNSSYDTDVYLLVRSSNGVKVWLNSKNIYNSSEEKGFELSFSEFIPLHLKKGNNLLVIKKVILSNDILFEGILCNKERMLEEYSKSMTGLILYPSIISNDTLRLTRRHQQILGSVLSLSVNDIRGDSVVSFVLKDKTRKISISKLQDNCSYLAILKTQNNILSQPFYKGNPDHAYTRFIEERNKLKDKIDYKTLIQFDALIYRLHALLTHSSRESDWWWQLKVSHIIYELDNMSRNYSNKIKLRLNSFGIYFRAYVSNLDNTVQYYLLIEPDKLTLKEKIPLVIVLRPNIENHYHFLVSPQMARYWSLMNAKYLANKYHYAIMIPLSRLYANESFVPIAESETFLALNDVEKYCNIDMDRIYLHGNCSSGYRCLSLACRHPNTFAAIGLYAPTYKLRSTNEWIVNNSPHNRINELKNIPIILHYDPQDLHTPYKEFEQFIKDCDTADINLTISSSMYSGLHYNVLLVGEEAFSFYKGRKKSSLKVSDKKKDKVEVIADFFSQPYIFVYDSTNKSQEYTTFVDSIKNEYERFLFSKIPLVASEGITSKDFYGKNIFFIGHQFRNLEIRKIFSKLPFCVEQNKICINGVDYATVGSCMFQFILKNPFNRDKSIVVYSCNKINDFTHIINFPWKDSLEKCILHRI